MPYQELLDNLEKAKLEFKEFHQQHPDIRLETVYPEEIIITLAGRVLKDRQEQINEEIAYLTEDERTDGIEFGNKATYDNTRRLARINKRITRLKNKFKAEVERTVELHTVHLKALYLEKAQISGKKTAELSDIEYELGLDIYNAERALIQYNIDECMKFSVMEDVSVQYCGNTHRAPELPGVYFLLKDGEIIYIGHSNNLRERLNNNDIVRKYYGQSESGGYNADSVVCPCQIERAKELERTLISLAKPKENVKGAE